MIGQLFQHMEARMAFISLQLFGERDLLRLLACFIMIGPFQREVDEAIDPIARPDRDLPGDERGGAHGGEGRKQILDAAPRLLDLVDEQGVRNARAFELAQCGLCQRGAGGVRIDDDDGQIDRIESDGRVIGKAGRARNIDEGEMIPHPFELHEIEFGRASPLSRFRTCIADAGASFDRSLSRNSPADVHYCFREAGFTCSGGADQRNGARLRAAHPCSPHPVFRGEDGLLVEAMFCLSRRERKGASTGSRHRLPERTYNCEMCIAVIHNIHPYLPEPV